MEVKINREIRNYTESMFFGLSLRQLVFSLMAVAVAVGLYFVLKPHVGTETVSWMCVLGAAPFAAMGFVTYHGQTCEQFLWAWLRSELLEPKEIRFDPVNLYYEMLRPGIEAREKGGSGVRKPNGKRSRTTHRAKNAVPGVLPAKEETND